MKTTCAIRIYLLSISRNTSTDSDSKTLYPCSGKCSTCRCAVLMLRFIAYCEDPVAFAADARRFWKSANRNRCI